MSAYWFDASCIIGLSLIVSASFFLKRNLYTATIILIGFLLTWTLNTTLQQIGAWNLVSIDYYLIYAMLVSINISLLSTNKSKTVIALIAIKLVELLLATSVWLLYVMFDSLFVYNAWSLMLKVLMAAQLITLTIGMGDGSDFGRLLHYWRSNRNRSRFDKCHYIYNTITQDIYRAYR